MSLPRNRSFDGLISTVPGVQYDNRTGGLSVDGASGTENQAAIKSLSVDTWVQVAPISLPRLKRGENHLQYEVGDRYGLRTIPMLVSPDTSNPKDLEKYLVAMPENYDPKRHTSRIFGDTTWRLAAPAGRSARRRTGTAACTDRPGS